MFRFVLNEAARLANAIILGNDRISDEEYIMKEIQRITSFSVDHDKLIPGIYISRVDGDITTFDLRTRTPNAGEYMDNVTMHSVEHMFATYVRNSEIKDDVIYFGPMGCRTGFYLLTGGMSAAVGIAAYFVICHQLKKRLATRHYV